MNSRQMPTSLPATAPAAVEEAFEGVMTTPRKEDPQGLAAVLGINRVLLYVTLTSRLTWALR